MSGSTYQLNHAIFPEMMSHPALFTHSSPNKIMILGDENKQILHETTKHTHITDIIHINKDDSLLKATHPKVTFYSASSTDWREKIAPQTMDVIIHAGSASHELIQRFFTLLHADGILIQQSASPFEIASIKATADQLRLAGFNNQQILHFPQPDFSSGWRSIIMCAKQGVFKRVREKAVYAKPFKTYYYNLDTHKASLVLPEFMREHI